MTTADWRIEPQKTRSKTANRAARVFIADFYSGNIARVHSSVRFHFSEIQSYYSLFLQVPTFTSHLPMHEECTPVRFLFAIRWIHLRFVRAIARFQRKFSANYANSAYFQRKSRKVSVKVSANPRVSAYKNQVLYFHPSKSYQSLYICLVYEPSDFFMLQLLQRS